MQFGNLESAHIYSSHAKSPIHRRSARTEMANTIWTNIISRVSLSKLSHMQLLKRFTDLPSTKTTSLIRRSNA